MPCCNSRFGFDVQPLHGGPAPSHRIVVGLRCRLGMVGTTPCGDAKIEMAGQNSPRLQEDHWKAFAQQRRSSHAGAGTSPPAKAAPVPRNSRKTEIKDTYTEEDAMGPSVGQGTMIVKN